MMAGTRVAREASTRRRPTPNPPQATPIMFICVHPCKNPKHPSNPTNRSRCMRYCRNGHRRRPRGTGAEDGKRSSSVLTRPPTPRQHRTGLPHPPPWSGLTRPSRANRATPERWPRPTERMPGAVPPLLPVRAGRTTGTFHQVHPVHLCKNNKPRATARTQPLTASSPTRLLLPPRSLPRPPDNGSPPLRGKPRPHLARTPPPRPCGPGPPTARQ